MEKKILVVDDNPDVIYSIKEGLKNIAPSLQIIGVESGQECLDSIGEMMPDLILMDIMMPGLDGWEVVARLKSNDATSSIPIIFLTGKTDDLSKSMGLLTSQDYLEKPFEPQDLMDRINGVFSQ